MKCSNKAATPPINPPRRAASNPRIIYTLIHFFSKPDYFLSTNMPQIKKTASTIVDTIVIVSGLPLRKAGILLRRSKPKTTSTALIKVVLFFIFSIVPSFE